MAIEPVVFRPGQVYAVDEILRTFSDPDAPRIIVLHSPTGTGKSLIHAEVVRRLGVPAVVTTPQRSLVKQYDKDPRVRALIPNPSFVGTLPNGKPVEVPGLSVMTGRGNYPCYRDALALAGRRGAYPKTADQATCVELDSSGNVLKVANDSGDKVPISCQHKRWREDFPPCEYYLAKAKAELSPLVVSTLAYFYHGFGTYNPEFPPPRIGWTFGKLTGRSLLIIDEAHGLEREIVRFLTDRFTEERYEFEPYESAFEEWWRTAEVGRVLDNKLASDAELADAIVRLTSLLGKVSIYLEFANTSEDEAKVKEKIDADLEYLSMVVGDLRNGVPWVVKVETPEGREAKALELTPVLVGPILRRSFWNRAEKVILSSGYFVDVRAIADRLGLDGERVREISVRSDFAAANGPVVRIPVASMTREKKGDSLPLIARALWRILNLEPGRGVVHTVSFENAQSLYDLAPSPYGERLVLHEPGSGGDRDEFIESFRNEAPPNAVLLSPSVTEGLDLPGDLGTFVVFIKAPFLNLSDERVARRRKLPDGRDWYDHEALAATVQGRGRVLRYKTDVARTYLLDESHIRLLDRWHRVLPSWFIDAVHAGDDLLDGGLRERLTGGIE